MADPEQFKPTSTACKLCKSTHGNRIFQATEKMLGLGGAFHYLECGDCGVIQLLEPPSDLAAYYPNNYYSYADNKPLQPKGLKWQVQNFLMRSIIAHRSGQGSIIGSLVAPALAKFKWVRSGMFQWDTAILDVGCGTGALLRILHRCGFKDLTGADPFLVKDLEPAPGLNIWKRQLKEMDRQYGFIMLNHCYEHLSNPESTMREIYDKLVPGGVAMIRIPIAGCYAWDHYGTNWVQLDAPRHFFLHTEQSIQALAEHAGLVLEHVEYDSTEFQFVGSEKYVRGLQLNADSDFLDADQIKSFRSQAKALNSTCDGDSASFYLRRIAGTLT